MSSPPAPIVGVWLHSQEEDRPDARVYRPPSYGFPPARGRSAVEFRPDGTYVEHDGGPDDRGRAVTGEWRDLGDGRVRITIPGRADDPSTRRIVSCTPEMLVIAR